MEELHPNFDISSILETYCLNHLPVKSLSRFKAVCKSWHKKILSLEDSQEHSESFKEVSGFFIQEPRAFRRESRFNFLSLEPMHYGVPDPTLNFTPGGIEVKASSNGLLCVREADKEINIGPKHYYICSPIRGLKYRLPLPKLDHGPNPKVVLVYESSSGNYKLVATYSEKCFHNTTTFFDIFDSKTHDWNTIRSDLHFLIEYGVYHDSTRSTYWRTNELNKILSLSVENGESNIIEASQLKKDGLVAVFRNKLSVINISPNEGFKVYAFDKDKGWENSYCITLNLGENVFDSIRLLHSDQKKLGTHGVLCT